MTDSTSGLRRRLILWAAGLSASVAVVLVLVVNVVIDATAEESLAERVETYTTWSTVVAGIAMVLVATGLAAWASRRVLEPVAEMARTASEWSEHALDRRFDLGPPTDEIRSLGQTLDGLLDKVSRVILGEQRLTSELAHELRSPLTAIRATADLIAMRPDLDDQLREDVADIQESCAVMTTTMAGLLDLARAGAPDGGGNGQARAIVELAVHGLDRGRVTVSGDLDHIVAVPPELAARALAPLLENATRLAEHVAVAVTSRGRWVDVTVADDGPGVPADLAEAIFSPGHSGGSGSGLGLALARRIARSVGGEVRVGPAPAGGGAAFVLSLPAG